MAIAQQQSVTTRPVRAAVAAPPLFVSRPIDLAVILPTFNEAANVEEIIRRLDVSLQGIGWEAIFVDDNSGDGTADRVREIARLDRRVRVVHRFGRRGLASAVVEGMLATAAPFLAVMDADLQHDEKLLPKFLEALRDGGYDVAIGTRYAEGGSVGEWDKSRERMSQFATKMAKFAIKTPVADPMSGFFAVRRELLMEVLPKLSNVGFKILLDMLASTDRQLRISEIPYTFGQRVAGDSKLDKRVLQEYLILLIEKIFGNYLPVRFLMFASVGALGLLVHLLILSIGVKALGFGFYGTQIFSVIATITFNYVLNNCLTYRDMRHKGIDFVRGLLSFYAVCFVGALGNIGVGELIYEVGQTWWVAGIAGAAIGVVWNYAASAAVTWRQKRT